MDSAGSNVLTKDPLLQPLTIKKLTLRNRIMSTSHACGLEVGGMPQEAYHAIMKMRSWRRNSPMPSG
jgi:2,4-dienoyl-CoA reductase-like NADH-dependent reductase (Old Yellow Enzyme family)